MTNENLLLQLENNLKDAIISQDKDKIIKLILEYPNPSEVMGLLGDKPDNGLFDVAFNAYLVAIKDEDNKKINSTQSILTLLVAHGLTVPFATNKDFYADLYYFLQENKFPANVQVKIQNFIAEQRSDCVFSDYICTFSGNYKAFEMYLAFVSLNKEINELMNTSESKTKINLLRKYYSKAEAAIKNNNLSELINDIILNPHHWLYEEKKFLNKSTRLFPYLSECSCANFTREIRIKIENQVINFANQNYPEQKDVLNYLSLGAGNLLQDFILIGKLLLNGHINININLVEPLMVPEFDRVRQQFSLLDNLAKELGGSININYFKSITELNKKSTLDILVAIDFEDVFQTPVFNDLIEAHKLLSAKGQMFFSISGEGYYLQFSKTSIINCQIPKARELSLLPIKRQISTESIKNENELNITVASIDSWFAIFVQVMPKLAKANFQNLNLYCLSPKLLNSRTHQYVITNNLGFNEENLSYFLNLCLGGTKNINCKMFNAPDNLFNQVMFAKLDILIILNLAIPQSEQGLIEKIEEQHPNVVKYFNYGIRNSQNDQLVNILSAAYLLKPYKNTLFFSELYTTHSREAAPKSDAPQIAAQPDFSNKMAL